MTNFSYTSVYVESTKNGFFLTAESYISLYNTMIEQLEKVKSLVHDFNGKVINKRFVNEYVKRDLQGIPRLEVDSFSKTIQLVIFFNGKEREIYDKENRFKGYLDDNSVSFSLVNSTIQNDRLNAVNVIKNVDEEIERLNKKIIKFKTDMENYDTYIQKCYEIEKQIEAFKKEVPSNVGLNITINRPYR